MEMQAEEDTNMDALIDRLTAATSTLERLAARETELESLLAAAETTIAALKSGRKTLPAGVATLLAKDGSAVELGALDSALVSLSVEQRIAVKAQLLRSGLIG